MFRQFKFGNREINYILLHDGNTKSVKITVEFEHGVEVIVPIGIDDQSVAQVLQEKGRWILQKLDSLNTIEPAPSKKEFVSGEKYAFLGRLHTLVVSERSERQPFLVIRNNIFEATIHPNLKTWDRHNVIRGLFQDWYQQQAQKVLIEQVNSYAKSLNLHPTQINVMNMVRRWGSCTPQRAIYLNWRLIMAPMQVIDYVIVHELCHLSVREHSPRFWDMVGSIIADYEVHRTWLRINGPSLTV